MSLSTVLTPIADSPITAILSTNQSEKTLRGVVESLTAELEKLRRPYEILIVDGGSTDQTPRIAEELGRERQAVKLLRQENVAGIGTTVKAGLAAAQHPLIFTMPADGSYQASDLPKLLAWIDQVDLVCGYRRGRPWLGTQTRGWLTYLPFGLWLKDVACPFRLYRKSIFDRIPIQSTGSFAHIEILAKANALGCLLTEIEVEWNRVNAAATCGGGAFGDALRVFTRPDFGPAILPGSAPEQS
jgi:glycosyltransferase involved in cell wall biosynthesis